MAETKLTVAQLISVSQNLNGLIQGRFSPLKDGIIIPDAKQQGLPISVGFSLYRLAEKLVPEMTAISKREQALLKEYGIEIDPATNNVVPEKGDMAKYLEARQAWFNEVLSLDFAPIKLSAVSHLDIPADLIMATGAIFTNE
jgi:hypothetical protein